MEEIVVTEADMTAFHEAVEVERTGAISNLAHGLRAVIKRHHLAAEQAQAAELKAVLDRESATHARHDAKIAALEAERDALVEALEAVAPYLNTMLVEDDPDEETIGWEADGAGGHTKPIDFTMGQIRKVNAALANLKDREVQG